MQEMTGAGENDFFHPYGEEIVHSFEGFQASGAIFGAVDGEGGDRRWRRVDAFLQRLQSGIAVRWVKRVAIITQGCRHHTGLTESAFHTLHDLRWRDILGGGIAPPALQK